MKYNIVAGGAGFIGANLVRRLLENNNNTVVVLDNFSSGKKENLSDINTSRLYTHNCDITNSERLFTILHNYENENVCVYNLACPASPPFYQADPIHTTLTCVDGSLNLLKFAMYTHSKILFASTSEVYGDPSITPQNEDYRGNVSCNGIRSCYDEGKRCAESLYFDFMRQYGTDIKVVRLFNTYGPYMRPDDGRFISNFINQSLDNKPMTIYGDGSQTRSICYVDDTVDGLIKMMDSKEHGPINIGNPQEKTVKDWAYEIHNIIHPGVQTVGIINKELPGDDPLQRCPDITRAKELLGWEPKVDYTEGLIKTIDYYKSVKN